MYRSQKFTKKSFYDYRSSMFRKSNTINICIRCMSYACNLHFFLSALYIWDTFKLFCLEPIQRKVLLVLDHNSFLYAKDESSTESRIHYYNFSKSPSLHLLTVLQQLSIHT